MVDDPLKTKSGSHWNAIYEFRELYPDKKYFFITYNKAAPCLIFGDNKSEIWGIQPRYNYQFFCDGNHHISGNRSYNSDCSKEELLDWLKVNYAEYFDWLLFHPEWLV